MSVKPGKPPQLNYTAQVSVDTAHHVITQIQTDHADKKDSQCLPSLVSNTVNDLNEQGLQVEHARLQASNREKIRRLRSSTGEPILDTLVNYLAMRRVNTRGIKQASKCIIMSAITYNLKKPLKWESRKIKLVAMAKMKEAKNALHGLVFLFISPLRTYLSV